MNISQSILNNNRKSPEPTIEEPTTRSEAKRISKFTMTQLHDRSDTRIAEKTERSITATMESLEGSHNLIFVQGTLKRATRKTLESKLNDEEVIVAFKTAIIPTAIRSTMIRSISVAFATEEATTTPLTRSIASKAWKDVSKVAQQSIFLPRYQRLLSSMDSQLLKWTRRRKKQVAVSCKRNCCHLPAWRTKEIGREGVQSKASENHQVRAKKMIHQSRNWMWLTQLTSLLQIL